MPDLMDISCRRHTVRSYTDRPVEPEKLAAVLEAGRWAPTAVNAQPQAINPYRAASIHEGPVLVLQGDDDTIVTPSDARRAADAFLHARMELVHGADHGFVCQGRRESMRATMAFFASVGAKRSVLD